MTDAYTTDDPNNPFAAIKGFFGGGGLDANDPNVNQALRQRIAMAMMARQRPFPKTIGEGLSAIGNAIGDTNLARMMEQQDVAARAGSGPIGPSTSSSSSAPPALPSVITRGPQASTGGAATAASLEPQDQSQFNAVDAGQPTPHPVADMITKLESNRGAANAAQPASMVDKTYGQYGAFAKDYGSGEAGVHSFAQKVLAANPDATVGDMYSGYVLGTGKPGQYTMADLKTTTVPGARGAYGNLVNNSPIDPNTPLSKFYGAPPTTATAAASPDTQDATLREVTGVGGQPTRAAAYAPTASLDPRDGIARALVNRNLPAPGVPPVNPTIPGATPPVPSTLTPPTGGPSPADQGGENIVTPAQSPTVMSDVRPVPLPVTPGTQTAQAQPPADVYVQPKPTPPPPPVIVNPMSDPNYQAALQERNTTGNPYRQQNLDAYIRQMDANAAAENTTRREVFQKQQDAYNSALADWRKSVESAGPRQQELAKATKEADIAQRFGGPAAYQEFNQEMSKSRIGAVALANTMPLYDQSLEALKTSYTGTGAEAKLNSTKMLRQLGYPGDYSPTVATEILRSRMSAIAAGFIKGTVGSQSISDRDVAFVEQAYSGKITMEPESIRRLLNIAQEAAVKTVNQHNDRLLSVANDPVGDRGLRNMYRVPMQYGQDAEILKQRGQDPQIRAYFDQKYGKGHAAAVLSGKPYGD